MAPAHPSLDNDLEDHNAAFSASPSTTSASRKPTAGKTKARKSKPSPYGDRHLISRHSSCEVQPIEDFPDATPHARAEIHRLRQIVRVLATRLGEDPTTYGPHPSQDEPASPNPASTPVPLPSPTVLSPSPSLSPEPEDSSFPTTMYRAELPEAYDSVAPAEEYWNMPRSEWSGIGRGKRVEEERFEEVWGAREEGFEGV